MISHSYILVYQQSPTTPRYTLLPQLYLLDPEQLGENQAVKCFTNDVLAMKEKGEILYSP